MRDGVVLRKKCFAGVKDCRQHGVSRMRKILRDVTLVCASGIKIPESLSVVEQICQHFVFGGVNCLLGGESEGSPKMTSKEEYSRVICQYIPKFIGTSHLLICQWDSGLIDPTLWNDEWLKYDYIGAPWPPHLAKMIGRPQEEHRPWVGNGGFSLRSQRLMDWVSRKNYPTLQPGEHPDMVNEDVVICRCWRQEAEAAGFVFAPPSVAAKFAVEYTIPLITPARVFGFHGHWWQKKLIGRDDGNQRGGESPVK